MSRKHLIYLGLMLGGMLIFAGQACVKEDFFGLSSFARIKTLELSNQASATKIDNDLFQIVVPYPPGVDIGEVVVRNITLSSFATTTIAVGDTLDLNSVLEVTVIAEDGTQQIWSIEAEMAGSEPQLPNSDFQVWYQTSTGYFEPGESASNTIWGTGNPGTQLLNILTVTPLELTNDNRAARMETHYNGPLAATFGTPISAGSIFIGKFNTENIDINDPAAAIDFGSPFSARPTGFTIKYVYNPGEENQDRNEDPLPYSDQCDIYILLELRTEQTVQRLGTAWFRSEDIVDNPEDIEVKMNYGPLDDSFPDFMKPKDHTFVSADSAAFMLPTHITFVAVSSFDGDNFAGAVGSILIIDDLELVYE